MTDPKKMAAFMRKATPSERHSVSKYLAAYITPSMVVSGSVTGANQ